MQAGNHQHMRQPRRAEHIVHPGRKCAFITECGRARHTARLLAQHACKAAAQRVTHLLRCAGYAAPAPHHLRALHRSIYIHAVRPAGTGIAGIFRCRKFQLRGKNIALRKAGHGFQISVKPCRPAVYLRDAHYGVHTAGQVAGRRLPHHGLHLRRGARKGPSRLHHSQRINAAPQKGKARPRTAHKRHAPPGPSATQCQHRKQACRKSRRQPKGRQRHKRARKAGQAERQAEPIYRAAHQSWKNRGSGARKVMSPRSAASPSASTAARATTVQSHFDTSASSACRLPPVEITSSAITTRLPCM